MSGNVTSGSAVERLVECPSSASLPQARTTTPEALGGRSNHDRVESAIRAGTGPMPGVVRGVLDGAEVLGIEESYVLDVESRTARRLGEGLQRGYGKLSAWEIPMTLDLRTRKGGTQRVHDWKSRMRVSPAADNWQLRVLSLAVRLAHGLDRLTIGLGYLDDSELDEAEDDGSRDEQTWYLLRRAIQSAIDGDVSSQHEGPWCAYCPAISACPAKNRMVRMFAGELSQTDWERAAMELPLERAGDIYDRLESFEKLLSRAKEALKARAAWEPLPVDGGRKRLTVVQVTQNRFDSAKAKELLAEHNIEAPTKATTFTQAKKVKA